MKAFARASSIAAIATHLDIALPMLTVDAAESDQVESYRTGQAEFLIGPQYMFGKDLGFDGGTTAHSDGTWGFGAQFGYNFNEHLNLGLLFSWSQPDYQGLVQPTPTILSRPGIRTERFR